MGRSRKDREKLIWRHLLSSQLTTEEMVLELADLWTTEVESAEEEGYDMAAQDITTKLQNCIPAEVRTVPEARAKTAWTDATQISLHHLGNYKNRKP